MRAAGFTIRKIRGADGGCRYFAWAPDIGREAHERQMKVRYEIGEAVPLRRPMLGMFGSVADARAVCEAYAVRDMNPSGSRVLPGAPL